MDKTTIKKLPGSVISAIFTKPVERVMRMGFPKKQRFVEKKVTHKNPDIVDAECVLSYKLRTSLTNKQTNYKC